MHYLGVISRVEAAEDTEHSDPWHYADIKRYGLVEIDVVGAAAEYVGRHGRDYAAYELGQNCCCGKLKPQHLKGEKHAADRRFEYSGNAGARAAA